ncbi:carbohydrate-binding family 9-like protein [bacterium]|nr:carbohydrate-binding family 9-like protein [bacterium]
MSGDHGPESVAEHQKIVLWCEARRQGARDLNIWGLKLLYQLRSGIIIVIFVFLLYPAGSARSLQIPATFPAPAQYVCPPAGSAPVIDGRLDDEAWAAAPWTEPFGDIEGPVRREPRFRTRAKMVWTAEDLCIAAELKEPHVWAKLTQRDAVIYHDNDFEVFIDPDGDNHLYYELEINALGTEWDLMLVRPYRDGAPAVNAWDIAGLRTAVHVDGTLNDPADTDTGWTVEIAIPWAVLGEAAGRPAPPRPGDVWRLNFSRVQWRTEVVDGAYAKITDAETGRPLPEDNWVWSPQGAVAMHMPEMWGEVLFGDGTDAITFANSDEHAAIVTARLVMPVYYLQREFAAERGRFAASLTELGVATGRLPAWPRQDGAVHTTPLPPGWRLEMDASDARFAARLVTPTVTATVDETGRLLRSEGTR